MVPVTSVKPNFKTLSYQGRNLLAWIFLQSHYVLLSQA